MEAVSRMRLSKGAERALKAATGLTLAFIYIPLVVIVIYAFNTSQTLDVAARRV